MCDSGEYWLHAAMIARLTSTALGRRGIHCGWVVAAVTFLAMPTTSAALGLPGATLSP